MVEQNQYPEECLYARFTKDNRTFSVPLHTQYLSVAEDVVKTLCTDEREFIGYETGPECVQPKGK